MKCPDCGFESRPEDERCLRCKAFLRQVEERDLIPPRKQGGAIADWIYRIDRAWRIFEYRSGLQRVRLPKARWHPAMPALASLIVPGSGQFMNGRPVKALIFITVYAALLVWSYIQWYGSMLISPMLILAFLVHLMNLPYYITVIHTWIVFDAYNDCVRSTEQRAMRVMESVVVSFGASLLIILLVLNLRDGLEQRTQLLIMANVPNLAGAGIKNGDTLILDRRYYEGHPVLRDQITGYQAGNYYYYGTERLYGLMPAVIIGLPGERVTVRIEGIYCGKERVYPLPVGWERAIGVPDFTVPDQTYLVLPGFDPGSFTGFEGHLRTRQELGGKFIMIIEPRARRAVLP